MKSLIRKRWEAPQGISSWVGIPAVIWFLFFLIMPLGIVCVYSFAAKGTYGGIVFHFQLDNYVRATDWVYLRVFWSSFKLASVTAILCLLIGYPMAYVMATASVRVRSILQIGVVIPFWTNLVVRAYATKVWLSEAGPFQQFLVSLGLIHSPMSLDSGGVAVILGMVTNYLPFMVLPLYVSIEKFDFSLMEAAKDLGASPLRVLTRVLFPLTQTGIMTGLVLVFTPALGEFVIPDLLGGARVMLMGNLITEQFLKTRDWPFGAALSLILILMVLVSLGIYLRLQTTDGDRESGRSS